MTSYHGNSPKSVLDRRAPKVRTFRQRAKNRTPVDASLDAAFPEDKIAKPVRGKERSGRR
jgi:hypothetical protein